MKKLGANLFIGILGGFLAFAALAYWYPKDQNPSAAQETIPTRFASFNAASSASIEAVNFELAADKAVNAVVHVWTERVGQGPQDAWSYFFGQPAQPRVSLSSGSGVIVSTDGFIVTNNHVVSGANKIRVKLNNGESKDAELIGSDPSTDLALLKIKGEDYPYLAYGNSDDIRVGQWVLAVGNPFNLSSTVTAGIVSAKARNINLLEQRGGSQYPIESFIQTDAAVNPGNSGGALVGVNGELLGINTAIASNTGSYAGYSFAVPVNLVKKVVSDLYEFGAVQRAFLGVNIRDVDENLVKDLELPSYEGVYVAGIVPGGAAEKGGLKTGDLITAINQVKVKNVTELQEQLGKYRPGDKVATQLLRDGKSVEKTLLLRNLNGGTDLNSSDYGINQVDVFGAKLRDANNQELQKLELKRGVVVDDLSNSLLRRSGIKEGFIITHIDRKEVENVQQLKNFLENKSGGVLIEGFYPNGTKAYYGFGL